MSEADPAELARAWVEFAQSDLRTARLILNHLEADARQAGFHAQQAVEKVLKAAIVFVHGTDPPRTHDIGALLHELPTNWKVHRLAPHLRGLTIWVGMGRYPDVVPTPSPEAAEAAVALALQAFGAVIDDLRMSGREVIG